MLLLPALFSCRSALHLQCATCSRLAGAAFWPAHQATTPFSFLQACSNVAISTCLLCFNMLARSRVLSSPPAGAASEPVVDADGAATVTVSRRIILDDIDWNVVSQASARQGDKGGHRSRMAPGLGGATLLGDW